MENKDLQQQEVKAWVELITPERAKELLLSSQGNRKIKSHAVESYARDIRQGNWAVINNGIAIDKNGNLMDGHHRCHAIISTGIPVSMLVVYGVDRNDMAKIDRGRARLVGDILAIEFPKLSNPRLVACMAKWLIAYYKDDRKYFHQGDLRTASPSEIESFVFENEQELEEASKYIGGPYKESALTTARFILNRVDPLATSEFFSLLVGGSVQNSPTRTLEKALISFSEKAGTRSEKSMIDAIAIIFKAWNFWRKGKECQRIVFRATEPYPIPQ